MAFSKDFFKNRAYYHVRDASEYLKLAKYHEGNELGQHFLDRAHLHVQRANIYWQTIAEWNNAETWEKRSVLVRAMLGKLKALS